MNEQAIAGHVMEWDNETNMTHEGDIVVSVTDRKGDVVELEFRTNDGGSLNVKVRLSELVRAAMTAPDTTE